MAHTSNNTHIMLGAWVNRARERIFGNYSGGEEIPEKTNAAQTFNKKSVHAARVSVREVVVALQSITFSLQSSGVGILMLPEASNAAYLFADIVTMPESSFFRAFLPGVVTLAKKNAHRVQTLAVGELDSLTPQLYAAMGAIVTAAWTAAAALAALLPSAGAVFASSVLVTITRQYRLNPSTFFLSGNNPAMTSSVSASPWVPVLGVDPAFTIKAWSQVLALTSSVCAPSQLHSFAPIAMQATELSLIAPAVMWPLPSAGKKNDMAPKSSKNLDEIISHCNSVCRRCWLPAGTRSAACIDIITVLVQAAGSAIPPPLSCVALRVVDLVAQSLDPSCSSGQSEGLSINTRPFDETFSNCLDELLQVHGSEGDSENGDSHKSSSRGDSNVKYVGLAASALLLLNGGAAAVQMAAASLRMAVTTAHHPRCAPLFLAPAATIPSHPDVLAASSPSILKDILDSTNKIDPQVMQNPFPEIDECNNVNSNERVTSKRSRSNSVAEKVNDEMPVSTSVASHEAMVSAVEVEVPQADVTVAVSDESRATLHHADEVIKVHEGSLEDDEEDDFAIIDDDL